MFNKIISWSLGNKITVLVFAGILIAVGLWSVFTMKVDILPDINKPTVTIFAESDGMAAEEVERLILNPIESAIAGISGIERIQSSATFAQATINIQFADWGSDTLRNRQLVQERLSQAILPFGVKPMLGPSTSLLGEIMWIGISSSDPKISSMELRTLADWTIRPVLLKTAGVASVLVMGGDVREWQININAERMRRYGIMINDVRGAVENTLTNKSGGLLLENEKEYPIRIIVAPTEVANLADISIGRNKIDGRPIRLSDIASFVEGASIIRGSGAIDGKSGVILRIIRQPDAQTLKVTDEINKSFASLSASLPKGVVLHPNLFRQESFIRAGLGNVKEALFEGMVLVILVFMILLMNIRMTMITIISIPLSILITAIVFKSLGLSVNVMTLGGIAVAVSELVDDAIVDVENIFRRLRLWMFGGKKENRDDVVLAASREVRNSIVYATMIVVVVFLPIFFMPGIEGRLLGSLGAAYLVSIVASMIVALTIIPVLSSLLLNDKSLKKHEKETKIVQKIKERMTLWIYWCINNIKIVGGVAIMALLISFGTYFFVGKAGIPPFNEESMTVMLYLPPGTALSTTNEYVIKLEKALLQVKGVRQVSNIAGRAAVDPHGGSPNSSEIQIALKPGFAGQRDRITNDIQMVLGKFGGADFGLGQPITHRIEELLSGTRAPIVVKVFGDDPADMESATKQVFSELQKQKGIENVRIQQNTIVPEFRIYVDRNRLAEYGLSSGEVANDLAMGLMGDKLGQVRLGPASVNVVARYDVESKGAMASLRDLSLPFMGAESLGSIGDIRLEGGRNIINHEGGKRVLVVSANYQRSDVVGSVNKAKIALEAQKFPVGVSLSFEGNYKSQKEGSRRLVLIFMIGIVIIFGVLYHAFRSIPIALLIMTNIPTVFIGGTIGVLLTGGSFNLAHMVGFIALAGVVSRNGIMLISHCLSLVQKECLPFTPETIVKATLDRVVPILLTALTAVPALIPLIMFGSEPGKELLFPLSIVILGGIISSTIISLFLTPALFYRFGYKTEYGTKSKTGGF